MKKILTETEITKFLDEYCPNTTIEFFTDTIVGHNEDIGLYPSFNGSETSLKCVAYEYAFVKYAREKFEYLVNSYESHKDDTYSFILQFMSIELVELI